MPSDTKVDASNARDGSRSAKYEIILVVSTSMSKSTTSCGDTQTVNITAGILKQ